MPNWLNWKGLIPHQSYSLVFDRSAGSVWPTDDKDPLIQAVLSAFAQWGAANVEPGKLPPTGITFTPLPMETRIITLRRFHLGSDANGQVVGHSHVPPDDRPNGVFFKAEVRLDNSLTAENLKKVALHEIGHLLGLEHMGGLRPSTVMNNPSKVLEGGADFSPISEVVTVCDRDMAREAVTRPWP